MKKFLFVAIFFSILWIPQIAKAQTATLTIRGLEGTLLTGSAERPKIFLREVDSLGISPNPMGEATYDENLRGAFYSISLEITTSISNPDLKGGQLSVTRSIPNQANSIPINALYDADFGVRFAHGTDIHQISDSRPYIIRSNLTASQTVIQRKIGVFVSENLAPGRYVADVIYTLTFP